MTDKQTDGRLHKAFVCYVCLPTSLSSTPPALPPSHSPLKRSLEFNYLVGTTIHGLLVASYDQYLSISIFLSNLSSIRLSISLPIRSLYLFELDIHICINIYLSSVCLTCLSQCHWICSIYIPYLHSPYIFYLSNVSSAVTIYFSGRVLDIDIPI